MLAVIKYNKTKGRRIVGQKIIGKDNEGLVGEESIRGQGFKG